jgi:hypothetical protein
MEEELYSGTKVAEKVWWHNMTSKIQYGGCQVADSHTTPYSKMSWSSSRRV